MISFSEIKNYIWVVELEYKLETRENISLTKLNKMFVIAPTVTLAVQYCGKQLRSFHRGNTVVHTIDNVKARRAKIGENLVIRNENLV